MRHPLNDGPPGRVAEEPGQTPGGSPLQHDGADRTPAQGGWIVTSSSVQADEGVRWISFTYFPEPEPDLDDEPSGSWPRDPSISSKTSRLRRRAS